MTIKNIILMSLLTISSTSSAFIMIPILFSTARNDAVFLEAVKHDSERLEVLINNGAADVNMHDENKKPAIMVAIQNNNVRSLGFLLKAGANINAVDGDGKTALMFAAESSKVLICFVDLLIKFGADVNVRDYKGRTALMYAVDSNWIMHVKALVKAGAQVNALSDMHFTALMYANSDHMVEFLIKECGAKTDNEIFAEL